MKLIKLLALNIFLSSTSYATEGKFTFLGQGQCALYEGGLFDPSAMAQMVVVVEDLQTDCDLRMEYELDKSATQHQLEIENHHIAYRTLQKKYDLLENYSNTQITNLQNALDSISSTNKWRWFGGGIVVGVVTTYAGYRMFNE
mgnify:CR=1 FL=1|tara:strand:+ start:5327 stop:5755 length:429 start_codon:yes stop_codon:yes gene_type:complete